MFTRRSTLTLFSTLVVVMLVLSACAPATTPAPPPAATQAPAATMAPAATVAPAATAAPTAKPAKTWLYAVVPPLVHPFYGPFPGAIADATKDFNLGNVAYQMPQHMVQDEQNTILDGLVAKGYNALAIQPAYSVAGNAKIGELVDAGMLVVTFGGCPTPPSKAPFCLATDVKQAAYLGATKLIGLMGGKGNLVHLTGAVADVNSKLRMDGVQQAVSENPGVTLLQTIGDIDTPQAAPDAVASLLASKGSQINGILCTAYNPAVAVAAALQKSNPNKILAVGIDTDASVIAAIKSGTLVGTVAQNPYGMAYLSLYSLNLMAQGYTWDSSNAFFQDSGSFFIDQSNVDNYQTAITDLNTTLKAGWVAKWIPPK